MRPRIILAVVLVLAVAGLSFGQGTPAAKPESSEPTLTELQKAKADILALKVQVAQLRATLADRENKLASYDLTKEQAALAEEFLKQTKAPKGWAWDWQKMAPYDPATPEKKE